MFYLVPHPKLDRPRRGSPRMFTIDWVEKYLSRVRPWHVLLIWGPVISWLLVKGAQDPAVSAIGLAGLFLLGILGWTLMYTTALSAGLSRYQKAYPYVIYASGLILGVFGIWFLITALSNLLLSLLDLEKATVEDIMKSFGLVAGRKQLELACAIDSRIPDVVRGDPSRALGIRDR